MSYTTETYVHVCVWESRMRICHMRTCDSVVRDMTYSHVTWLNQTWHSYSLTDAYENLAHAHIWLSRMWHDVLAGDMAQWYVILICTHTCARQKKNLMRRSRKTIFFKHLTCDWVVSRRTRSHHTWLNHVTYDCHVDRAMPHLIEPFCLRMSPPTRTRSHTTRYYTQHMGHVHVCTCPYVYLNMCQPIRRSHKSDFRISHAHAHVTSHIKWRDI